MKKRMLSLLLAVIMVLSLMPFSAMGAAVDEIQNAVIDEFQNGALYALQEKLYSTSGTVTMSENVELRDFENLVVPPGVKLNTGGYSLENNGQIFSYGGINGVVGGSNEVVDLTDYITLTAVDGEKVVVPDIRDGQGIVIKGVLTEACWNSPLSALTKTFHAFIDEKAPVRANAFENLTNLKSLSGRVTEVGSRSFCDTGITAINFQYMTRCTSLHFPEMRFSFYGCNNLKSLYLPSLYQVDWYCLYSNSLETVYLPRVSTVQAYGIQGANIKNIILPSVRTLAGSSIAHSKKVKLLYLPKLTSMSENALNYSGNIGMIPVVTSTGLTINPDYFEIEDGVLYTKGKGRLICLLGDANVTHIKSDIITSIDAHAFSGNKNIISVDVPNLKRVSDYTFYGASNLTSFNFENVIRVHDHAFQNSGLENANLVSCIYIGEYAFSNCASLTTVSMPVCTDIDTYAFRGSAITDAYAPELLRTQDGIFENCAKLKTIDCPKLTGGRATMSNGEGSTTYYTDTLKRFAHNCTALTTVNLPETTWVGDSAFQLCSKLKSISIPKVINLGANAFAQCNDLTAVSLTNVTDFSKIPFSPNPKRWGHLNGCRMIRLGSDPPEGLAEVYEKNNASFYYFSNVAFIVPNDALSAYQEKYPSGLQFFPETVPASVIAARAGLDSVSFDPFPRNPSGAGNPSSLDGAPKAVWTKDGEFFYQGKGLSYYVPANQVGQSIAGNYTMTIDETGFEDINREYEVNVIRTQHPVPSPPIPTNIARTVDSITILNVDSGIEFSLGNETDWTDTLSWDNLNEDTDYTIFMRYKETDFNLASDSISFVVRTKVAVASVNPLPDISVQFGTTPEDLQAQLESKYPKIKVTLSNGTQRQLPVIWKVSDSDYNGEVSGNYTVYGEISCAETEIENPENKEAEIEVKVPPDPQKEIISVNDPQEITVRQYATLSNEENRTTEFGPPTIFPKLPENVTIVCEEGTAELPVTWNVWECDTSQVGKQTIKGYPVCDGTKYWNSEDDPKYSELKVTVQECSYMFIDATVSDISLDVLPGTTIEELNVQLKEEGKWEIPLYLFDLDSGDQLVTFYPLTLKAEHCSNYQMDVPGDYEFIIPWPDNIFPSEEGDLPEVKVTVHVSEPLEIIDVELETITPYQSVPIGHEKFPDVPQQVTVTLEGGIKIPVDVVWDWSTYHKDLAADQLIIGELINLPSKARQPEGQEFTGKLKATVVPVAYEIEESLSEDVLFADAGLTLMEITQILQPTLDFRISSITEGIDLTLTRTVAVMLEDEKNPQFDPWDTYADFVTGTLDLPENITFDSDNGFDQIPLFTEAVTVLSFEPCSIIAREGVEFADIPNKPDTVVATLSSVGPDGENKKVSLSVDWGTGEGYDPYPPDLTDDTPVDIAIAGKLVNKPLYIAATNKKPVLTVSVCREFDIEAISPNRIPGTGELEVPLGSSLEDIYNKLDQHTVQLTLKSTNGVLSKKDVTFELKAAENPNYEPDVAAPGSYTLIPHIYCGNHVKNPKGLQLEIHIKTITYDIATAKVVTIRGIEKGTAFTDLPLPETAGAVRDDGETEFLPTTWDGSKYNPDKTGGQFVNGTFNTPLPIHLNNPDNRQPRAYIIVANTAATVLSMEQVFEEPGNIRRSRVKAEEIPGYVEHKYLVKYQYQDGSVEEEIISLYSEIK